MNFIVNVAKTRSFRRLTRRIRVVFANADIPLGIEFHRRIGNGKPTFSVKIHGVVIGFGNDFAYMKVSEKMTDQFAADAFSLMLVFYCDMKDCGNLIRNFKNDHATVFPILPIGADLCAFILLIPLGKVE